MKYRLIVPVIVATIAGIAAMVLLSADRTQSSEVAYSELLSALDSGRIAVLTVEPGRALRGRWRSSDPASGTEDFVTPYPLADIGPIVERANRSGTTVAFATAVRGSFSRRLAAIGIPLLIFAGVGYFLFLHLRSQGMGTSVGHRGDDSTTTFEHVAGTQGADEELREIVEFLQDPAAFQRMGARVPKGVLLVGPPGTGKTLMARAVAGEAGVPFYHLSGSEVTGFLVGLGALRIRSLFSKARKKGGVIFIDELDALGGARGRNRAHNEDDRTLNQLLVEMDGFEPTEGIVVVGATNRPEDLDAALKRPGRFDRIVTVGLPTVDGRAAILELHSRQRNVPLSDDVDFVRLARLTPGSSGAELANLINEAAIIAVRQRSDRVEWSHFEVARDRMLLGKERVGFRAQEREWKTVAWHEAGHAIAGVVACPEDGLHKVTIQPRGRAMGVAHFAPEEDRHLHSRAYLEAQIIKGLGGRVAEELVFGSDQVTGGAESDLVQINRIARHMIYRLGMGEDGGLIIYDEEAPPGAQTLAAMDEQVRILLDRLYLRARDILMTHRPALDALAKALLEKETLSGDEALTLLAANGLVTPAHELKRAKLN